MNKKNLKFLISNLALTAIAFVLSIMATNVIWKKIQTLFLEFVIPLDVLAMFFLVIMLVMMTISRIALNVLNSKTKFVPTGDKYIIGSTFILTILTIYSFALICWSVPAYFIAPLLDFNTVYTWTNVLHFIFLTALSIVIILSSGYISFRYATPIHNWLNRVVNFASNNQSKELDEADSQEETT